MSGVVELRGTEECEAGEGDVALDIVVVIVLKHYTLSHSFVLKGMRARRAHISRMHTRDPTHRAT